MIWALSVLVANSKRKTKFQDSQGQHSEISSSEDTPLLVLRSERNLFQGPYKGGICDIANSILQ